ncbi:MULTISPECIES: choice-of-anchor H family protein [unclassified Colwellia]|uniref:choice-of-anchor H family protein n=1 Tax=unclassified Colwellia TaxID=196834 RepID=UPI0015F3F818|nr:MULTISPECIES: choice-of-anchor H family protein [unclassified Colwellia]MBA6231787.1 choice-of-anchor H family protein [Colwellia sp. MB02u-7]MBA6235742.1 choice-of-anchor H family protein [Colwellia sp. MB02u-11]MBA6255029.1 choice-of-anchor H family protein [Colwellia sp. MB3u-28]MBA6259020.1 choice-of-anchor H family protein [Colwellia sp. MB3u-41]MBA6298831.1 choice-of-anchor H family protein [Colwellia sp. MB3u-22]
MLLVNNATQTERTTSLKKLLLLVTFSILPLTDVTANELNVGPYTVSQGALKNSISEQQRKKMIETTKLIELPDQLSGKATTKSRVDILKSPIKTIEKSNVGHIAKTISHDYYADFSIYSAMSFLHDDYDEDGYYQTFSITFDADIYSYTDVQWGEVYALLYLSKNGGPWAHYFTTDNFIIEGNSDVDAYEVISTFMSGYASDHYDVLIDLYQVGYSEIVASYSADDTNALYALPIESAEYDEPYIEVIEVVEVSGGSIYWLIWGVFSMVILRNKNKII